MTPLSPRQIDLRYAVLQGGYWMSEAALLAYQTPLLQSRGFSGSQIGVLVAVRCLAGIFLQPLIGAWADRHPEVPLRYPLELSLLLALAAGLLFALFPGWGFLPTLALFVIFGGLESSAYPLIDAMAVQFIRSGVPIRYSLSRGIGSLSYAVTCVLLGLQAGRLGIEGTLWTHALLLAAVMVLVWRFPTCPPAAPEEGTPQQSPHSALALLRDNPRFTLMLFAILFGIACVQAQSNFLINVLRPVGGGEEELGFALFLMAAVELPGTVLCSRLRSRGVPSARLLLIAFSVSTLKVLGLALAPSVGVLYLVQLLQMFSYGFYLSAVVYFVSDSVPAADQVKGQTLLLVFANGLGGSFSGLVAGRALDLGQAAGVGPAWMLASCLGCGLASVVLALAA